MFLMESPKHDYSNHKVFANFFNWTMTYRNDSDFFRPYGKLEKIGGVDDKNDMSFPAGNGK